MRPGLGGSCALSTVLGRTGPVVGDLALVLGAQIDAVGGAVVEKPDEYVRELRADALWFLRLSDRPHLSGHVVETPIAPGLPSLRDLSVEVGDGGLERDGLAVAPVVAAVDLDDLGLHLLQALVN